MPPPDRLNRLETARDSLHSAIDGCESMRDLPSLIREYRAVLAEIDELSPKEAAVDAIDEIANRRAARRPAGSAVSGRSKQSR